MDNNDILRRIRYTFSFSDTEMMNLFSLAEHRVDRAEVSSWLKKDGYAGYREMADIDLAIFLNGLINLKRGKKEGPQIPPESELNNNLIFRKLRIALNMKDTDILETLKKAGRDISKHELSAFFRKPGQKQYRECQDQFLRNFLYGLQLTYHKEEK